MKKILFLSGLTCCLVILFSGYKGKKYSSGAPPGFTGSPADVYTCTACHGGTDSIVQGWITTNVPSTGYIPGNTYTVTVTVPGDAMEGKGFEVSPQKTDGRLFGTLIAGTNTYLVGKTGNPAGFRIYPNPSNGKIRLSYHLKHAAHVMVVLFDLKGKRISTLLDENRSAGPVAEYFNLAGKTKPGIYLLEVSSGNGNDRINKVILN